MPEANYLKNGKKNPLTKKNKKVNRGISSKRVVVENSIRKIKIFRIMRRNAETEGKYLPSGLT